MATAKRILCIWLPQWPLQRIARSQPELRTRPIVLHRPDAHRSLRVVDCNAAAGEYGIAPRMPVAEALSLAKRKAADAAPFHFQTHDPLADREALVELAHACERYSPVVGLEDAEGASSLLADVTGLALFFGGEQALAERAARELVALHLDPRIAVADTIGAAWAVAHYQVDSAERPLVIAPQQAAAALAPLPAAALRLPEDTLATLGRLGIEQVGQLLQIPRSGLRSRFGPELLLRLDQALGAAREVIAAVHPPTGFSAEWSLEYSTSRPEMIDFVLVQLMGRLGAQLAEQGRGALELFCRLSGEKDVLAEWRVGLFRPSAQPDHLLGLLRMQFERLHLRAPVAAVFLEAPRTAELDARQQELFESDVPRDSQQLAALVDRLTGRLGREAVVQGVLRADAQPELAWRAVPLVAQARKAKRPPPAFPFNAWERPLHLFVRPEPIEVIPSDAYGFPLRFRCGRREYEIVRHWGPERLETGWWRKRGIRRDYYRIETRRGERFWIFRRLSDGRWFWHGSF